MRLTRLYTGQEGESHFEDIDIPPQIALQGQVEIMIGDGTRRQFGPGAIMLTEDTTGRGHISRAVDKNPRPSIFVTLE